MNKQYIGDSVYVERDDGWPSQLILTTENGSPQDPSNRIVLKPLVWRELLRYVKRTCEHDY